MAGRQALDLEALVRIQPSEQVDVVQERGIVSMRERCRVEGDVVYPCADLEAALEPDNTLNRGVSMMVLYKLSELKPVRSGVVLRSGQFRRKGVMLIYCPFCGERIGEHLEAEAHR